MNWNYAEAFSRNRGLITGGEQLLLRDCRVAVAGLGGVGGSDAITLARLGIGRFTLADPDTFCLANTNRQHGALRWSVGLRKAEVIEAMIRDVNPEADVDVMPHYIEQANIGEFLQGCAVAVDALDAFAIDARRLLYREARKRGIPVVAAGPVGFSTAWIVFGQHGMTFDEYFAITDEMDDIAKFAAYIVGMVPAATHRSYVDMARVSFRERTGPSASLACQLASGVVACETIKILLGRGERRWAPWYHQFDAYALRYVSGRLRRGNRGITQRIKRAYLEKHLRKETA